MYGTPYIFHFVHPLVKKAEIMVQRVNFERNLKNIRPATVRLKSAVYYRVSCKYDDFVLRNARFDFRK